MENVAPMSIIDQLRQQRTGSPQMPNMYGTDRPQMPPPNYGVPAPEQLPNTASTAQPQRQAQWWEEGYTRPDQAPATQQAAQAQATQQSQSQPQSQQPAQVSQPPAAAKFTVSDVSLYGDSFKHDDIGRVIDSLATEGRINPLRGIPEADMSALLGGDLSKLPSILNAAVVAGIREAVGASTALVNSNLGNAFNGAFDQYGRHSQVQGAEVKSEYKTPAERALADMYKAKYVSMNPNARSSEISAAVKSAMDSVGSELVTARQPANRTTQPTDWATELN